MLGICFFLLCFTAVLYTLLGGDPAALSNAALDGAGDAMTLMFSLGGTMALWGGILNVLEETGVIARLSRYLAPMLGLAFPGTRNHPRIREKITAAISANMLGIGNAATPLAVSAMEAMQKENPSPHHATDDMITFAVLATATPNLLPTTLIALRRTAGSAAPYAILVPVWIVSLAGGMFALLLCRGIAWAWRDRHVR